MTDDTTPHAYGTADPANRQPPAANGMRGEGAATPEGVPDDSPTPDGPLPIVETSGITAAETRGEAGPRHAALADGATEPENDDQTRNAGAENMRDRPSGWDEVDERSDESFPASDPPPTSRGAG